MHPLPIPHVTEEKEDNKYNKYYASATFPITPNRDMIARKGSQKIKQYLYQHLPRSK